MQTSDGASPLTALPLSLYVHLPWCLRKCPYCDFNSHTAAKEPPFDRYLDALLVDLQTESAASADRGRPLHSIFIGGGTPSLFPAGHIGRVLNGARSAFGFADDIEITMEANPGALEYQAPAAYRAAGVNRLSIGAQSFSAQSLQRLGRIHGPEEISVAVQAARDGGFDNINLDLMFGLPGQRLAAARDDVERAIALEPEHVSYYQLTLEPNTVFYSRVPEDMPDEDTCWDIQEQGLERLQKAGYAQYEVSAFSLAGRQCRHNLNYWRFGDYVAVGAGAHGKLTADTGEVTRYRKPPHPGGYMAAMESGDAVSRGAPVNADDLAFEFMLNALRLHEGFLETDFEDATGLPGAIIGDRLDAANRDGLLARDDAGRWRPTGLGRRFLNDLQARFLPVREGGK